MIKIFKEKKYLYLSYTSDFGDASWIHKATGGNGTINLKRTFTLGLKNISEDELIEVYSADVTFVIGKLEDNYYRIDRGILTTKFDVYIHESVSISINIFIAVKNISIFSKIDAG